MVKNQDKESIILNQMKKLFMMGLGRMIKCMEKEKLNFKHQKGE